MRDHELELIAALVEGRLEDETEARALIESTPEHRAEYEAQRTAYEALSVIGTAGLSEAERTSLRRDVWTELRAAQTPARARTPWYYRWVPALAGMFVVVGLVTVLNQGGADESAGTEAAQQLSAATGSDIESAATGTTEAVTEATEDAGGGGSETDQAASGDDEEAMEEAVEETDGAQEPPGETRSLTPTALDFYSAEADMVRSGALEEGTGGDVAVEASSEMEDCLLTASLSGYVPLGIQTAPLQSGDMDLDSIRVPSISDPVIVAIPEGADLTSAIIAFVDRLSCDVIYLDE